MPSSKPTIGVNDLQSQFPEIAAEAYGWDPRNVTAKSSKKKDWKCKEGHIYSSTVSSRTGNESGCPFCSGRQALKGINDLKTKFPDIAVEAYGWDPETVKSGSEQKKNWKCKEGHLYSSTVVNRTLYGNGCSVCSGRQVLAGFNDLQTKFPDIAAEAYGWDPDTITAKSGKKKDWRCKLGHIYSSVVCNRTSQGSGCPVCAGQQVLVGFNDLQTKFPDIAAEADGWDPSTLTKSSGQRKDWKCKEGHIYSSTVYDRTKGTGCPVCSGNQVLTGFNDLQTKFPDIAEEAFGWDPSNVIAGTEQKKNWKCKEGHMYNSTVAGRTRKGLGCPICSGNQLLAGFNDLKTKFPQIAAEAYGWDPSTVSAGSNQRKDWRCKIGHLYSSFVNNRTSHGSGCSVCAGQQVLVGFNDLQTKFPDIAAEAYEWDPGIVTAGSNQKKDWKCKKGHIYSSTVTSRTNKNNGTGCPICAESGFNPDKNAWFYLMERPGEQQLGISNVITDRLRTHELNGWNLIEHTTEPALGQKVLDTEKAFKKWLKDEIGLMEGTTENWSTTKMEVHSLAELKARSGIETDLF